MMDNHNENNRDGNTKQNFNSYTVEFTKRECEVMKNIAHRVYTSEERKLYEIKINRGIEDISRAESEYQQQVEQMKRSNAIAKNALKMKSESIPLYKQKEERLRKGIAQELAKESQKLETLTVEYNQMVESSELCHPVYKEFKMLNEEEENLRNDELVNLEAIIADITVTKKKELIEKKKLYYDSFIDFAKSCTDIAEAEKGKRLLEMKLKEKKAISETFADIQIAATVGFGPSREAPNFTSATKFILNEPQYLTSVHAKKMLLKVRAERRNRFNNSRSSSIVENESEKVDQFKIPMKRVTFASPPPQKRIALSAINATEKSSLNIINVEVLQPPKQKENQPRGIQMQPSSSIVKHHECVLQQPLNKINISKTLAANEHNMQGLAELSQGQNNSQQGQPAASQASTNNQNFVGILATQETLFSQSQTFNNTATLMERSQISLADPLNENEYPNISNAIEQSIASPPYAGNPSFPMSPDMDWNAPGETNDEIGFDFMQRSEPQSNRADNPFKVKF